MPETLNYHDVQTVLVLVDNWRNGHLKYADGELFLEARLDSKWSPSAASPIVSQQVLCPAVGIVEMVKRKRGGKLSVGQQIGAGERVGTIRSIDRVTEILAQSAGTVKTIIVQDGQFVQYGQTMMDIEVDEREIKG